MRHCRARQNKEEEEEERDRVSRMSDAKMQENRGCQDFCSRGREGSRARAGANARVKHHACMCMFVSIRRERKRARERKSTIPSTLPLASVSSPCMQREPIRRAKRIRACIHACT